MLNSFDARLGKLETSILPIHRSTQKLTKLHDRKLTPCYTSGFENIKRKSNFADGILTPAPSEINGSLQQVQTVVDYFDIATKEEPFVAKGLVKMRSSSKVQDCSHSSSTHSPQEDDLTPFLKSVESLKDALAYLQKTKYKASDRAINHLVSAVTHLF